MADLAVVYEVRETALAAGWGYAVVCGRRPHVMATLDVLSSQRRPMADPLRLVPQLLAAAAGAGPLTLRRGPVPARRRRRRDIKWHGNQSRNYARRV